MLDRSEFDVPPWQEDEFLPPIHHWTRASTALLVGMALGGICLASIVEYNVTIQAPATVRPRGELSTVQATTGGTIRRILVRENQAIERGDIIAELGVPDRARLAKLQERHKQLEQYIGQYQTQISQIETELQHVNAVIIAECQDIPAAMVEVNAEQFALTDPNIEAALAQLSVKAPEQANQLMAQRDRLQQKRTSLVKQVQYDQMTLEDVNRELNQWAIVAPTRGTVFKVMSHSIGQAVQPGQVIAQIVPQSDTFVVKARVSVQDISQVEVGHSAQLRISAYPYPDYGTLKGRVTEIAPDVATAGGGRINLELPYYEVTITPERSYLTKRDHSYPLQAGMEARADIISRKETVLQFLLRKLRLWADV